MDYLKKEGSEYIDNLLDKLWTTMYQGLLDVTNSLLEKIRGILPDGMSAAKGIISNTPEDWNSDAYKFIETVSNDVIVPIAAVLLTLIFCWQLITMMKESNQMHSITPQSLMLLIITLIICLIVCANSFKIVNGLFSVAKWAVDHMPGGFTADEGAIIEIPISGDIGIGDVFMMFCNLVLTLIAEIFTYVIVVAIYIRVNVWYLELLMYMAVSPIPFSTFINKEWGQVGMNYLRKMLAIVFEGFFMLLAFGLYQAISGRVLNGFVSAQDEYLLSMVTSIGCGVALLMIVNKAGTISSSVFNAH